MEFLQKLFKSTAKAKSKASIAWVNDLDGMDDFSAIEFSTLKLSEDFKKNMFQDELSLEELFSIDEKTHIIVERITTHFVNIENISIELEERISNAVFMYHRQLFLIYFTLAVDFAEIHHKFLHTFLARAFRNATQMIKWRYYNYQSSPANVWQQISQLYIIAEKKSLVNAKIQSYSDQEPVSLSTAYIHACMLGTLENMSLKCQQLELVSKILLAWTAKITVDKVFFEKEHLFYVDTASNKPAKRIRNFKHVDSNRYWSFNSINSKIELCISLIEFNISPKQPLMKELISNKHAFTTFEALHAEWLQVDYKRQRRSEERTKVQTAVFTSFGFRGICDRIQQYENIKFQRGEKAYQGDKSLEERLALHSLNRAEPTIIYMDLDDADSRVVNQCTKGLGLHVNKHASEVSLGMLVGVATREQKNNTKLGLVRGIKPTGNNELYIGIELLANVGFYSIAENTTFKASKMSFKAGQFGRQLEITDNYFSNTDFGNTTSFMNSNFGDDPTEFACLYLPKEQSISGQETLIIPKLQYNKNDIFKVNLLGEDTLVRFTKSFERHGNWVLVTFTTDINQ